MPFAGYRDFAECVRQNQQADDPEAYCGSIKHKVEDKMQKAIDAASYLHEVVFSAVSLVAKGHDPVEEAGDKKLKDTEGTSGEGAQDDQAFAVAFGPDNYDKLVKRIIKAPVADAYRMASRVLKAIENKQFNFPGNIEEALKKAHAAIHGREMWDARYGDVCDLITRARKILHSIEKTAEVSRGGSAVMVMGKADPGATSPVHPKEPSHSAGWRKHRGKPPAAQKADVRGPWAKEERTAPAGGGRPMPKPVAPRQETPAQRRARWQARDAQKARGMGVSGARGVAKPGWATTKQPIPGGGSKIKKAVQKAVQAVSGR